MPEARRLLTAVARRGYAQARFEIGTRHMYGNQLPRDINCAIKWLEKAAAQGIGQATQSLGHLQDNNPGQIYFPFTTDKHSITFQRH